MPRINARFVVLSSLTALPIASLLLGMPSMAWPHVTVTGWLGLLGLLICNIAILFVPALSIRSRLGQRLFLIPLLVLSIFSLSYTLHNGASPGPAVLVSIVRTNLHELAEVLPGLARAYALPLLLFAFLMWCIWRLPPTLRPASRLARLTAINIAIVLADCFLLAWAFWPTGFARAVPAGAEYAVFPGNLLFTAYNAYQTDVWDHLTQTQRDFRFHATALNPKQPLRVVLVIGESSSAEHWQLAGYSRPTNPKLSQLATGQLIFFSDVLSGGTSTRSTVPVILTRATPSKFSIASNERSIVSVFAESGYWTAWISNQDRFPYSEEANQEIYINPDWGEVGRYDGDLLPLVDRQIEGHDRLFLVVHTLGSHVKYRYRVPEEDRFFSNVSNATTLEEYDDTIRYTDQFLAKLIDQLAHRDDVPSVLLYVSDHGQDLARSSSGELSQGLSVFPQSLIHVPLLVWMSGSYLKSWPSAPETLKGNRACPHSQIDVFYTLAKLGSIQLPSSGTSLFDADCNRVRPVSAGSKMVNYGPLNAAGGALAQH